MKLSELIADAERTLKEFGDMPVVAPIYSEGFDEAVVRVEKYSVRSWDDRTGDYVTLPIAYVVA
ncbi:hypothetical protein ACFYW9_19460 [Streptomyces sp. NPDC002698]|uniref:hypothetical protein n=1 Tax=Streptomyces sp. NPDC002698 TaxID=3364660 RepID=UPI00367BBC6D